MEEKPVQEEGRVEGVLKSCRICLAEGRPHSNDSYLSPCRCSGSLQHVHDSCIKAWIKSKVKNGKSSKIRCQICTYEMDYKTSWKRQCNSCPEFKERISKYSSSSVIFLVLSVIIISLIVLTIVLMEKGDINLDGSETEKAMGMLFLVAEPVLLLLMVGGFVWGFCLKKELEVEWVGENKEHAESIDRMINH